MAKTNDTNLTPFMQALMKIAERVQPTSKDVEQKVVFNIDDSIFRYYIDDVIETVLVRLDPSAQVDVNEAKAKLKAYLIVLLGMRIDYVNRKQVAIKPSDPMFTVPAVFSTIMEQIGRVDVGRTHGFVLVPEFQGDYWEMALKICPLEEGQKADQQGKVKWLVDMSRYLRRLFSLAHIVDYADCMSKDKTGSLDFMSMHIVAEEVLAPTSEVHPVYAMCAAVVGIHQITGMYMHNLISYGTFAMQRFSVMEACNIEGGVRDDKRYR